jgi:predicted kinase
MTDIILARGLPASGKSTWAQAWVAESPETRFRVNRDELRQELYGAWHMVDDERGTAREKEDKITQVENNRIQQALRAGKDIVVDNTNLNPRVFHSFGKIAKQYNANLINKDFPIDINEAIRRNKLRDRVVPESVIHSMKDRYLGPNGEFHLFPGTYPVKPFKAPDGRRQAVIFDMDGTLAEISRIRHYVNGKGKYRDFDTFHRSAVWVPANEAVLEMTKDARKAGLEVVIVTAREERYRDSTQKWLDDHGVDYANIYMRPLGDMRKDGIVKKEILKDIKQHYDVVHAVDDRPEVIDVWHNAGISTTYVPGLEEDIKYFNMPVEIDSPFKSGRCLRCGRKLKGDGPLGPECAKLI